MCAEVTQKLLLPTAVTPVFFTQLISMAIVEHRGGSCWSRWKKPIWLMSQLQPFWGVTLKGSCKENLLNGQILTCDHPSILCERRSGSKWEYIWIHVQWQMAWPVGQCVKRLDYWLQQDLGQKYIDGYREGKTEYEDLCFICQCPWKRIHLGRDS